MKNLIILTTILFIVQFLYLIFAQSEQKPKLVIPTGHASNIISISFGMDGDILASASADAIKLWSVKSGQELNTLNHSSVKSVAFSSVRDILASGSSDMTVKLWDIATGQELWTLKHPTEVDSVVFSPNGKILASGSEKIIFLWDVLTGKLLKTFKGHSSYIRSIAFSPDGNTIATASMDNSIMLWNVEAGNEIKILKGHSFFVNTIAFSSDGKTLVSGSSDKTIKLWNITSGIEIKTINANQSDLRSVMFSPDGKIIASGGLAGQVKLWDAKTGQELQNIKSNYSIYSLSFSPDGKTLAFVSADTVKMLDTINWQINKTLTGHAIKFDSIVLSPDSKVLAAAGNDKTVKLLRLFPKLELKILKHSNLIDSIAFSPSGKILASGSIDSSVILWDVESGQEIRNIPRAGRKFAETDWRSSLAQFAFVSSLAFSHDGKLLATGSVEEAKIWNVETGQMLKRIEGFPDSSIRLVTFSQDNKTLGFLCGSQIKIWDVINGKEIKVLDHVEYYDVDSMGFSPDGKTLATRRKEQNIDLWDLTTGKRQNYTKLNEWVVKSLDQIMTTPNSKVIRFDNQTNKILLLNGETQAEIASLIALDENDWIIVTPEGRFDISRIEEAGKLLSWIYNDEPFKPLSLDVFLRDYYEPGLLQKLIANEDMKPIPNLSLLNRTQPIVNEPIITLSDTEGIVSITFEVANTQSEGQKDKYGNLTQSGVYDVRLFRDGQVVGYSTSDEKVQTTFRNYKNFDEELAVWREANKVDLVDGKKALTFKVKLPNNSQNKQIVFSAYAFNSDRVKSETVSTTYTVPSNTNLKTEPRKAYLITFGVNKYDNPEWNLQFAGNDARKMQEIIGAKLREGKEFDEIVEIPLVSDDEIVNSKTIEKRDALKPNVQTVLELLSGKKPPPERLQLLEKAIGKETLVKISQAKPDDMVLVSFSSHGYADQNGIFYILPTDIGKESKKTVTNELLRRSISSDELSLWLRDVDAGEMVMIVDACYAASAVGKNFKPAPMGSRGLGQLAFDKGMKILTATQAANVAIEAGGTIGHGLLTFALLKEGIEKKEADFKAKDNSINLKEWLEYGEFSVPKLYEKLAKGELKGINKGTEVIDLSGNNKTQVSFQTPTLFDFTKKKAEMILVKLP